MKIAHLHLDKNDNIHTPAGYLDFNRERHELVKSLSLLPEHSIYIFQRAAFNKKYSENDLTYYFIQDEFKSSLRWWQEPVSVFEKVVLIKPDLIQLSGLDKPLNFRWLRRMTGDKVRIVGLHTGEDIWAQRNLWLQQFGLRVADGFIFRKKTDTEAWIRAAVILPRQPLFILNSYGSSDQKEEEKWRDIYRELLP